MTFFRFIVLLAVLSVPAVFAAETDVRQKPGLGKIQLVTDSTAVTPGETLTLGLILSPEKGFHTYWKGPGIVGVATQMMWTLPEGFSPGEIIWPPPERVDMVGINAHGYKREVCLLTDIKTPDLITEDEVTIKLKAAWMACSTSCHPGYEDFELTLPVNHSDKPSAIDTKYRPEFQRIRSSVPPKAPEDWTVSARLVTPESIQLDIKIPGIGRVETDDLYFFCFDLQVDSDKPQQITSNTTENGTEIQLLLARPNGFAPDSPSQLAGLLFRSGGWSSVESKWVEITAPWPSGTFSQ